MLSQITPQVLLPTIGLINLVNGACPPSPITTCDCSNTRFGTEAADCPDGIITYICNDYRLGPIHLPQVFPLISVVNDYDRFGHLKPGEFLAQYWDSNGGANGTGDWRWPEKSGYLLDTEGNKIVGKSRLKKGTRLDRFGPESGVFVAAAEGPFSQRALPPSKLNTNLPANETALFPAEYHVYELLQDISVDAGLVTPWFGQPGLGSQYVLPESIMILLEKHVFKRLHLRDLNPPNTTIGCGRFKKPGSRLQEDL